jgi:hypothetical protein
MSDTPRTDERVTLNVRNAAGCEPYWVPAEFSRQLEREIAEVRAENERLRAEIDGHICAIATDMECQRLKRELAEALEFCAGRKK